jgi:hypothetical protein
MRALKVAMLLLLLAAAGVGAGVAYTLGAHMMHACARRARPHRRPPRACVHALSRYARCLLARAGRASELHSFHLQFDASVVQLQADFQSRLNTLVKTAVMGGRYISSLPDDGAGRGAHIPGFQAFGEDLQAVSGATLSAWIVLVTDAQRAAFEAAAVAAAARLDPSGALAALVRETGIRTGAISNSSLAAPAFTRAPPAPLYAAVWSYAPRTPPLFSDYFLFNPYAEPLRRAAMDAVRASGAPAMTDLAPYTFGDETASAVPSSVIFAPAWNSDANTTYGVGGDNTSAVTAGNASSLGRAICSTSFHWETLLEAALPAFIDSLVAVLRSPRGVEHTFRVAGRTVHGVGAGGDAHARLVGGRELAALGRRINVTAAGGAVWSLAVYPTRQLRDNYLTNKPRDNALGIAAAVLACALLFGCDALCFVFRGFLAPAGAEFVAPPALNAALAAGCAPAAGTSSTTGSAPRRSTGACWRTCGSWSRCDAF